MCHFAAFVYDFPLLETSLGRRNREADIFAHPGRPVHWLRYCGLVFLLLAASFASFVRFDYIQLKRLDPQISTFKTSFFVVGCWSQQFMANKVKAEKNGAIQVSESVEGKETGVWGIGR